MIGPMRNTRMRIGFAFLCGLLLCGGGAGDARAQYMSCQAFMDLDENLRHLYLTGFVEGLTYTQLELQQLVNAQSAQKEMPENQQIALTVMSRVANNIGQGVPAGLTVAEVSDKLEEMCGPDENKKSAFVNIYSEYSLALRQAARLRQQQAAEQAAAKGGDAKPPAAPTKPKAAPAKPPAVGTATEGAKPAEKPAPQP